VKVNQTEINVSRQRGRQLYVGDALTYMLCVNREIQSSHTQSCSAGNDLHKTRVITTFNVCVTYRVFKNRLKYDLKSNQIICRKYDLKLQSNRHFPKRFKIKIKSNRLTKYQIIHVFLVRLSTCIKILKIFKKYLKS
jgi:hypothetical protein